MKTKFYKQADYWKIVCANLLAITCFVVLTIIAFNVV